MVARNRRLSSKIQTYSSILTIFGLTVSSVGTYPAFAATNSSNQVSSSTQFTDINGNFSWAVPAIQALTSDNIVSGRDPLHFAPQDNINRAEFAKLLVLSLKLPLTKPATPTFTDVPATYWGYPYIETAYANGLIFGTGNNEFAPTDPIKREDVVAMIARSLLKSAPNSMDTSSLATFADQQAIDSYAQSGVAAATQLNIVNGYADKTFRPLGYTNRAEASQIIYKMMQVTPDQIKGLETPTVTIAPKSVSVMIGGKQVYGAVITYPDGSTANLPISWSVTGNVGTIDAQGNFSASNAGQGTITAAVTLANGKQVSSSTTVQVTPQIAKIIASPATLQAQVGDSKQLSVEAFDKTNNLVDNPNITWSVSGNVGTVANDGTFTATQAGQGTITATVQQDTYGPVTASIPVTVTPPYHLAIVPSTTTSYYPGQNIPVTVQLTDDQSKPITNDSGKQVTLTVTMPNGGTYTRTATDTNGIATFTLSHTMAGAYSIAASGQSFIASNSAQFTVLPGALSALNVFAAPSPWVTPSQTVTLKATGADTWGNTVPIGSVPVQASLSDQTRGTFTSNGTIGADGTIGTFTAAANATKGDITLTLTANAQGQTLTGSTTVHIYTGQGSGLVSGKGVWMMWSDWKNHNVDDTLAKLKQAGVTHIYLEVATTADGFYGKDALDDFLPKAHDQGFAVIGWVYAQLKDPWADAAQTLQVAQYTTSRGDKVDGIAPDLEDSTYLSATNLDTYSKSLRSNLGSNYPLIACTYPESWRPSFPWQTFAQYYDVIAPMDYWHFKEKSYSYNDVYNTILPEIADIRKATGNPYIAVTMIGQSYNMFDDAGQEPTGTEITAAMQAAKDSGCVGYSTYRGYTATPDEWNAFANFKW